MLYFFCPGFLSKGVRYNKDACRVRIKTSVYRQASYSGCGAMKTEQLYNLELR